MRRDASDAQEKTDTESFDFLIFYDILCAVDLLWHRRLPELYVVFREWEQSMWILWKLSLSVWRHTNKWVGPSPSHHSLICWRSEKWEIQSCDAIQITSQHSKTHLCRWDIWAELWYLRFVIWMIWLISILEVVGVGCWSWRKKSEKCRNWT